VKPSCLFSLLSDLKGIFGTFAFILLVWQSWIVLANVPSIIAPSPLDVFTGLINNRSTLLGAAWDTLKIALLGLILGSVLGFLLACLAWSSTFISGLILPGVLVAQSVPVVAMVPVISRVIGYDVRSVIAITVLISFFPAYVFSRSGLTRLPAGAKDLFSVLGASRRDQLFRLAIPAAIPGLLTALRLSAANCVLATLVAEFLMGTQGLGFLIAFSAPRLDLQTGWGAALLALIISLSLFAIASSLEQRLRSRWL